MKALDILAGLQNYLGHLQIHILQESGMPGKWLIITKTREDATKLIQQEHIMCKGNKYVLTPKVKRATLLTLPYIEPDITNEEIQGYFSLYGNLRGVAYEYYKEVGCEHIKTGRRLVFIELQEGFRPPPYCIIKGRKFLVCYKNRQQVCYHCNVTGHSKKHCPIRRFTTCFNCGEPGHSFAQCSANSLITYFFDPTKTYPDKYYPTNHKEDGQDPETFSGKEYGNIESEEEALEYITSFQPMFYDEMERYEYQAALEFGKEDEEEITEKQVQETLTKAITELIVKTKETVANREQDKNSTEMKVTETSETNENKEEKLERREIFARRAMVDQAHKCLCYLRKT